MALTLVTGPTSEPLTLQQAKDHLRLDTDDDDALVLDLIKAARVWVEGQTKRAILTQTWDYSIDWGYPYRDGQPYIQLPLNPVSSVTSITYVDGSSPNPSLSAGDYTVAARKHGSYIVPAYNTTWVTPRSVPDAVVVRFIAGESSCPKPLERAIALLVTHMYENRETIKAGQGQVLVDIPYTLEAMISPYRAGI